MLGLLFFIFFYFLYLLAVLFPTIIISFWWNCGGWLNSDPCHHFTCMCKVNAIPISCSIVFSLDLLFLSFGIFTVQCWICKTTTLIFAPLLSSSKRTNIVGLSEPLIGFPEVEITGGMMTQYYKTTQTTRPSLSFANLKIFQAVLLPFDQDKNLT